MKNVTRTASVLGRRVVSLGAALSVVAIATLAVSAARPTEPKAPRAESKLLSGQEAIQSDWRSDAPGVRRLIRAEDLPKPYDTKSIDNGPRIVPQPAGAMPKVPEGFTIEKMADGFTEPRVIVTAPNGDLFLTESKANRVRVLRDKDNDGKPEINQIFAADFKRPFGIAFWPRRSPRFIYIANTDSVVRFPYRDGDTTVRAGAPEVVVSNVPGGGQLRGGGHWTRDIVVSNDDKMLYLSVGSLTNVNTEQNPIEEQRARIFAYGINRDGLPDGGRVYATGIRNPVGLAIHPQSGAVWTSVNERDGLGDNLVPDYITSVQEGGFYGWPWFYIGGNPDPRKASEKPEMKDKSIVPDVLLQSHYASLDLCFYDARQFPGTYRGSIFAAQHGSWNRERRVGYKIVRVPMNGSRAKGEFEDFVTGFVTETGDVWGRPVGVTTAKDGSLIFTDDGSGSVWRVKYTGK